MLVYSRQYRKVTKRNSYTVLYDQSKFGLVQYFILEGTLGLAVIRKLEVVHGTTSSTHFQLTDSTYLDTYYQRSVPVSRFHYQVCYTLITSLFFRLGVILYLQEN